MSLCMIFIIPSAYNLVLSCLTHLELVRASKICHHTRAAVESYERAAFNINNYLSRFFDSNTIAFRNLQARTGTLVGGAAAFRFIERSPLLCNCIELLVYPQHASDVVHWLLDGGYSFVPRDDDGLELDSTIAGLLAKDEGDTFVDCVRGILSFEKATRRLAAQVLIAVHCPIEIVLSSRNTLFFTMITWEKAYCIFPRASLHNRRVLLIHDDDGDWDVSDEEQAMFRDGFDVVQLLSEEEDFDSNICSQFPSGWRWVNDSTSLCIHLDRSVIEHPSDVAFAPTTPIKSPMDYCGFQLCYDARGSARVKFTTLLSPTLQYQYTVCDSEMLFQVQRTLCSREQNYSGHWMDNEIPNVWESVVQDLLSRDYMALKCLEN